MNTKKSILWLVALLMLGIAPVCTSCSDDDNDDPVQQYDVEGTWYALYDADGTVGGGGQMAYSRLITACTFNDDGTGTWYKFMFTSDSGDPIALDGGANRGSFTYSVGTDGRIMCRLTWSQAPSYYPQTLTFTASGNIIKGQEGIAYDMKKTSGCMAAWMVVWTKKLTGGGKSGANSGAAGKIVATSADLGKVIGTDGKIYHDAAAAKSAGTTATAMIAYVGSDTGVATYNHGLAIALSSDDGMMGYTEAENACEEKPQYAESMWCVPDDDQWKRMFKTNGGDEASSTGLNRALTAVGGTALPDGFYWSSTAYKADYVSLLTLDDDEASFNRTSKNMRIGLLRACLVF